MSLIHAFILGLVQSLTEFFPVSSSAHLKLTKLILGIEDLQGVHLFDLSCHLGTLFAILYFLKGDIKEILLSNRSKGFMIFLATLPLVPAYFLLKPLRDFASHTEYLGFCLIGTGIILFLGQHLKLRYTKSESKSLKIKDILWIGTAQSFALIPGISRSASTISCAKILGWDVKDAVRFSFLLSIPTVCGGNALELAKLTLSSEIYLKDYLGGCIVAFFTALLGGFAIVKIAMKVLESGRLYPFAYYCICIGIITWIFVGW
jgi:undecaprenyl-diphosphatase